MSIDRAKNDSSMLTSVPTGVNVAFATIGNGNNATGAKGDRAKPFNDIAGANVVAVPGDYIICEGSPDERNVFIDGVTYIIDGDFRYTGVDPGGLIDDTLATGQNGKLVVNIFVNGVFNNENAAAVVTRIVNCSNAASIINIQCISGDVTQLSGEWGIDLSGGAKLNFRGLLKTEFFVYELNTLMNLFGNSECDNSTTFNDVEDFATVNVFGRMSSSVHKTIEVFVDGNFYCSGDMFNTSGVTEAYSFNDCNARIEGKLHSTGLLIDETVNFQEINGTKQVELEGGIETDHGVIANLAFNSINVILGGRLINNWNNAGGHGIVMDPTNVPQTAITENCTIILTHAAALSITDSGNAANKVINNSIPSSNRAVSVGLVQEVNSLNHDTDVR